MPDTDREVAELVRDLRAHLNNQAASAAQLGGTQLDPTLAVVVRLNVLVERLFGHLDIDGEQVTGGHPERLRFEVESAAAYQRLLDNAASAVRQARITEGVPLRAVPPTLVPNGHHPR